MKHTTDCVFITNWPFDDGCYQCGKTREEHGPKPSFPDWMEQQLGRNWVVASRTKRIIEKYGPDVAAITARKLKRMREQWLNIST